MPTLSQVWVLGVLFLAPQASFAIDRAVVAPDAPWSDLFGGTRADFPFTVNVDAAMRGRAAWVITVDRRAVARGEAEVVAAPGQPGRLTVRWDVPPVKDGVILRADLSVTVAGTTLETPLWVFPRDPFAGRARWLAGRKIALFDPERTTSPTLEAMGIPFELLRNVDAIAERTEGVVLVGEGISFEDERGLAPALLRAAGRGLSVLCLAPSVGTLPLPDHADVELPVPARLTFRGRDAITALDKRLDDRAWPPDGRIVASSLRLSVERGRVVAAACSDATAYPWVEAEFTGGGRLLVCGFAVIAKWDSSPAPRFLFARILETMAK